MARKAIRAAGRQAVSCPACGHPVVLPTQSQRVKAGLRRARQQGIRLGRPPVQIDREHVRKLRREGLTIRTIAERLDIPKSTVAATVRSL